MEFFKQLYYTFMAIFLVLFTTYYFNDFDLIMNNIHILLVILVLICMSLLLLYVINLIYIVVLYIKYKKQVRNSRIVPVAIPINITIATNNTDTANIENTENDLTI